MKIAVFGASGTIGSRIVAEALKRRHEVTAVVRDGSRATIDGVPIAVADVSDKSAVAQAVVGHDAVVSAVGGARDGNHEIVVQAARALIAGLPLAGVTRLVIVGGAGSLQVVPGVDLVDSPEFPAEWRTSSLAQRDALRVYETEANDLEWTYISPAHVIEPGERTGRYRTGSDLLLRDELGESRISIEDYAVALLDELERSTSVRRRMSVAY